MVLETMNSFFLPIFSENGMLMRTPAVMAKAVTPTNQVDSSVDNWTSLLLFLIKDNERKS